MNTYLTPAAVAERLSVSDQTVLNLIERGELPALRISPRVIRVDPEDLAIYLLSRRTQGVDVVRPSTKLGAANRPLLDREWELLERATKRLADTQPEIEEIFVSGSYALGVPDAASDLDFVVVSSTKLDFEAQAPFLALVSRLARRPDVAFMDREQFNRARKRFNALRSIYGGPDASKSANSTDKVR